MPWIAYLLVAQTADASRESLYGTLTLGAVMVARELTWWGGKLKEYLASRSVPAVETVKTVEVQQEMVATLGSMTKTLDLMHQELRAMSNKIAEIQGQLRAERRSD